MIASNMIDDVKFVFKSCVCMCVKILEILCRD